MLAAIVLGSLLLSQCGGDDDDDASAAGRSTSDSSPSSTSSSPTDPSPSTTGSASPTAGTGAGQAGAGQAGTLTAGTTSVLPLTTQADPASALSGVTGQDVQGTAVQVLEVPADEGFWVGTSDSERIWVQLTGGGESPYQVEAGDVIDLQGTLVPHAAGFAAQVGVTDTAAAAQLDAQGHHVEAAKNTVALSS
ncbi:hypothetical protein [Modestobacter lacusdianchii]